MKFIGIIPARYQSSRFPGKPLALINGKPMIQQVYEHALKAGSLNKLVVATDDSRIFDCVKNFGGEVIMTRTDHQSGSDRCNEVIQSLSSEDQKYDVAINIQGDEPFLKHEQIELVARNFKEEPKTNIATLIKKIQHPEELFDPNVVKVVVNHVGEAVYFSRLPIPYMRDVEQNQWINRHTYFKHIGIYGYRTMVLSEITSLNRSELEKSENLEQLRWIENGYRIKTSLTDVENISIDRPEDLKKITDKI